MVGVLFCKPHFSTSVFSTLYQIRNETTFSWNKKLRPDLKAQRKEQPQVNEWLPSGGHHTHNPNKDAQEGRLRLADLLLLEDIRVFAQAQLAEKLGEVGAFEAAVQVTAITSCQRGNAVHVVAAA